MIQYGSDQVTELKFEQFRSSIEIRDHQWIDVELRFECASGSRPPADLADLTALLICTRSGEIFQIVPQDEGRDCEYQFTEPEKEQLRRYYETHVKPQVLELAARGEM